MMKKNKEILVAGIMLLALLVSCTVQKVNIPASPVQSQMNFQMSDLEFVSEVTGTAVQSYVFGIPYGGKDKYKVASTSNIFGQIISLNNRGVNNAMYHALKDNKAVDFVIPVLMEIESNRMFLGRQDSVTVRLKTFKIKVH